MADRDLKVLESVNLCVLRKSVTSFEDAIVRRRKPRSLIATKQLKGATLFFIAPPVKPTRWQEFLRPAFGADVDQFRSKHASAVLVFKAGRRTFAATFGYGRSLLNESALDPEFGLRAALNLYREGTLRAVDFRTIEERTRIERVQLSDEGGVGAFGLDADTALLRGFEARSRDTNVCERLAARWSTITVTARVDVSDLPELASKLLDLSKKRLPDEFQWIENVQRVSDRMRVGELDAELERRLDGGELEAIRLAIPEIADFTSPLDARLFKPNGPEFDSSVETYLKLRPRKVDSTIGAAKTSHKLLLIDAAVRAVKSEHSIYSCLVAEIDFAKRRYLLADGEWFELNREFVSEVETALSGIEVAALDVPDWKKAEREDEWIARAAKQWKGTAVLDKATIPHGGSHSKIEVADLVSLDRMLTHVKRRDKNSSGLSHLFSQGGVSSELLSADLSFRGKFADMLPATHKTLSRELRQDKFDAAGWTLAFVILGADRKAPCSSLPFFSKVNLRRHVTNIRSRRYRVVVAAA